MDDGVVVPESVVNVSIKDAPTALLARVDKSQQVSDIDDPDYFKYPQWLLNLYGLSFEYCRTESYLFYVDTGLTVEDVITFSYNFLQDLDVINERGYYNTTFLEDINHFLNKIGDYLEGFGYEKPLLGESKTSYTL